MTVLNIYAKNAILSGPSQVFHGLAMIGVLTLVARSLGTVPFADFMVAYAIVMAVIAVLHYGLENLLLFKSAGKEPDSRTVCGALLLVGFGSSLLLTFGLIAFQGLITTPFRAENEIGHWLTVLSWMIPLETLTHVLVQRQRSLFNIGLFNVFRYWIPNLVRLAALAVAIRFAPQLVWISFLLAPTIAGLVLWFTDPLPFLSPVRILRSHDITYAFQACLSQILVQIKRRGDILILGALAEPSVVASYAIAAQVARVFALAKQAVLPYSAPRLRRLTAAEDRATLTQEYRFVRLAIVFCTAVAVTIAAFFGRPILQLLGNFENAYIPLLILGASAVVQTGFGTNRIYLAMSGQMQWTAIASVMEALAFSIAALVLVPSFSAEGVALAILIASLVSNLVVSLRIWVSDHFATTDPITLFLSACLIGLTTQIVIIGGSGQAIRLALLVVMGVSTVRLFTWYRETLRSEIDSTAQN